MNAGATAEIFVKFVEMLKDQHIMNLKEMNKFGDRNVNAIRKMPTHHIILIAQNDIGRYNLYQLITASHMTYYARRPRIPKSLINEHEKESSLEVPVRQENYTVRFWKNSLHSDCETGRFL